MKGVPPGMEPGEPDACRVGAIEVRLEGIYYEFVEAGAGSLHETPCGLAHVGGKRVTGG